MEETQKPWANPYTMPIVQYPSAAVPEIHGEDPYMQMPVYPTEPSRPLTGPRRLSDDSYARQTYCNDVTTHAPRPHSHHTGQIILLDSNPSSSQHSSSPFTNRLSRSTGMSALTNPNSEMGSPPIRLTSDLLRFDDTKERVVSPGLPPGAMPPSPAPGVGIAPFKPPPHPEPTSSPGGSTYPWLSSPPPRSHTGTALPPYEAQAAKSQYQGSIIE